MSEPIHPDFDGANVAAVVPALLGLVPSPWMPAPVSGARATVLLVVDGMGWDAVAARSRRLGNLAALEGGAITTVVPSTTATVLTSIVTGLPPGDHGIVGFRFPVDGHVLNALRWPTDDDSHAPHPAAVQRQPAFCNRVVPVVSKSEFRGTGFTRAHMRDAHYVGWTTAAVLVEHVRSLVGAGERFVYAYYPGVDTVAHEFGLFNEYYERELGDVDGLIGRILDVLPPDVALVVTADHGQVDTSDPDVWFETGELAPLVAMSAGEARFRQLFAKPGAQRELLEAARAFVGDRAWVFSRKELIDGGWFGPEVGRGLAGRIGDVVLAGRESFAFIDPAYPRESNLKSAHGSLTAAEMLVPLLAARGRA